VLIRRSAERRRITTRLVGSLGVLATAAVVAGITTFGTFTDSTTPVDATVDTGVLSIELSGAVNNATVPAVTGGLLPGDTQATPFDLWNAGTVDWSSVTFQSWATGSSLLDTNTANGLQLTLQSCTQSWAVAGPGSYSCPGQVATFYSGPIIMQTALANAGTLRAGGVDHLLATVALPQAAGNEFKGQVSNLSFTFTATQRPGTAR
jgi:hypothetical protein